MNDERIENELRAWLAAEASSITMPDDLREAAAAARALPAPRWTSGRSLSLPRPLLAGVAGLLVVTVGTSLVLSGILPIGQADCSRVSVESVRAASEAVPGYTYRMTGTELIGLPQLNDRVLSYEYTTATAEFDAAYRAPDAWRLEYTVDLGDSYRPPTLGGGLLIRDEWDAYVVVGDLVWARPRGADAFARMPVVGDIEMTMLTANRLTDLLAGEAFRWAITGEPTSPPVHWTVQPDGDACRMVATNDFYTDRPQVTWQLELRVDPDTNLPGSATYRFATPEAPIPDGEGAGVTNATDTRMQFSFDYSSVPEITPPTDPDILPVSEEQARDDASSAGGGLVMDMLHSALGATEVFVARGTEATVLLVYEEGVRETERIIDQADDVVVEAVEGSGGRFLVVAMHDFRVSRVEVDYGAARTDEFFAEPSRLALVPFPAGKGEVVTWRAYDEGGNELVLNPRPPDV